MNVDMKDVRDIVKHPIGHQYVRFLCRCANEISRDNKSQNIRSAHAHYITVCIYISAAFKVALNL